MTRDKTDIGEALLKLEKVEDQVAGAVREAKRDAEGSSETPVIRAEEVDDLRDKLTQARADLVGALLEEEFEKLDLRRTFSQQVKKTPSGATIIFDEAQGTVETRKDATYVKQPLVAKEHSNVRTRAELPEENVKGERIEYVWVVYRPAANSQLGKAELLGAHDNAESAKKHAAVANRAGEVEIKPMNIQSEGNPLTD